MTPLEYLWSLGSDNGRVHVTDVGANPIEGDAPYKRLLDAGYATLTGFEPQAEALAALNERKSAAETYHPNALGAGGAAALQLYAHSGFTSLYRVRPDIASLVGFQRATRSTGSIPIQTARLDDLADVPPIDYLKIDVQGSELSIISHGRSKLAGAVLVQAEVRFLPLYEGEPSFGDLDREMRAQGFLFHDFAFIKRVSLQSRSASLLKRRSFRQVMDGDAFYVRDLTRADAMSDAQIWRLAVLADGVIGSPNLVVFALDTLSERKAAPGDAAETYLGLLPAAMLREI